MKNDTKILILVGIVTLLLVVGGVFAMSNSFSNQDAETGEAQVFENSVLLPENVNKSSEEINKVVIVEFSDFQCPACKTSASAIKKIVEDNKDDVTLVYRNFPLLNIHPNALQASYAAEAAANQGKFWEMHDMLFEYQDTWSTEKNAEEFFVGYAEDLGLDKEQFIVDVNSDEVKSRVQRDMTDGNLARVNATPSFYINGQKVEYVGSRDFVEALERELGK